MSVRWSLKKSFNAKSRATHKNPLKRIINRGNYIMANSTKGEYMLDMCYVRRLIKKHKSKAAKDIRELYGEIENQLNEPSWVRCARIVEYWSHSEVTYLPINTMDYINFYSKQVRVRCFINELNIIITKSNYELECGYFEYVSSDWKRQGITRSDVQHCATGEFLDHIFK
ncbi:MULTISPECIES: hypothetical protein [Pectobacterium]|uniref:hypothetical protein n=1 Tax=Pectobacterium TaxID=122277 RepID=UPI001B37C254|nr:MULTISPECIES: hypothetical protein [Pectobacterium]